LLADVTSAESSSPHSASD